MGIDSKAGFVGLVTAVSELGANAGALAIADNVTLRKEGALVCRPHYTSAALLRAYRAAFPYLGKLYYFAAANAIYSHTELPLLWEGAVPPAVRDDIQAARESRSNMYFASSEGIYKVSTLADTALRMSGLDPPAIVSAGYNNDPQFNNWLPTASHVAYRAVARYEDVNGLLVRSRPSGAFVFENPVATSCSVLLTIAVPTSSDVTPETQIKIEVYRSRVFPAAITIDDEMQYVGLADIAGGPPGYRSFWDFVSDIDRGVTLYTSPSRGGQEHANDRAPGAAVLERFRGSLFFGNTLGPHRVIFSFTPDGDATSTANDIGYRIATGTTTAGNAAITGVTPITGIKAGQHVSYGPWSTLDNLGAYNGSVVSVAGSTVTVTPAPPNTGPQSLLFQDAISIAGGPAIPLGSPGGGPLGVMGSTSAAVIRADAGYSAYELTPPMPGSEVTVVLERVKRGGAPFTVTSSTGFGQLVFADNNPTSKNDVLPNGLAWAEPDEPEHVPPKNYARVGDTGKAILALVSTRDRLLIFKEDGLFMMTGQLASNFALYPLDTTCLCILPGSTHRLQNTVYTLSNLGLVAVDEGGGVTIVSRPIQTEIARVVNLIRAAHKTSGLYLMPGLVGHTGAGDDAEGEYHLALGTSGPTHFGGPPVGGHVLVYSVPRKGFTTFSFSTPPVALTTDGEAIPHVLCAASILTPSTDFGPVSARICPRAFSDPALVGKLWTHFIAGFSDLTGTQSVSARFTSAESMLTTPILTEQMEAPTALGLIQLPNGSLLRHPMPRAVTRAFLLFIELLIEVTDGSFTFELLGVESRANVPNHRPSHGTGAG